MNMLPWQERVVEELRDLNAKRLKLKEFLQNPPSTLPDAEKWRLTRQLVYMTHYVEVLEERVANF